MCRKILLILGILAALAFITSILVYTIAEVEFMQLVFIVSIYVGCTLILIDSFQERSTYIQYINSAKDESETTELQEVFKNER